MMKWMGLALISICFFVACQSPPAGEPHIVIETGFGDIEAELYPDKAPKTVAAILRLVDSGVYQRCHFYRILSEDNQPMGADPSSLIQGGLWRSQPSLQLPTIPHESTAQTGLRDLNGSLSMARQDTGTASSEFFICVGDQPGFDFGGSNNPDGQGYAVFGRVTKGIDIVRKIYRQPENDQLFDPPVPIINIRRK